MSRDVTLTSDIQPCRLILLTAELPDQEVLEYARFAKTSALNLKCQNSTYARKY